MFSGSWGVRALYDGGVQPTQLSQWIGLATRQRPHRRRARPVRLQPCRAADHGGHPDGGRRVRWPAARADVRVRPLGVSTSSSVPDVVLAAGMGVVQAVQLLRSLLRFDPWVPQGKVWIDPELPPGVDGIEVRGVRLGGSRFSVAVRPEGLKLLEVPDGLDVITEPRHRLDIGGVIFVSRRICPVHEEQSSRGTARCDGGAAYYDIPPRGYGGIELMLAAPSTPSSSAEWMSASSAPVETERAGGRTRRRRAQEERLGEAVPEILHGLMAERILADLQPDVVHDHTSAGLLAAPSRTCPTLATTHGPVTGEFGRLYASIDPAVGLVAISDAQRRTHRGCRGPAGCTTVSPQRTGRSEQTRTTTCSSSAASRRTRAARRHRRGARAGCASSLRVALVVSPSSGTWTSRCDRGWVRTWSSSARRRTSRSKSCSHMPLPRLSHPVGGTVRHGAGRGDGHRRWS